MGQGLWSDYIWAVKRFRKCLIQAGLSPGRAHIGRTTHTARQSRAVQGLPRQRATYMWRTISRPNSEQETSVASGIRRAKS